MNEELIKQYQEGNIKALDTLINNNMGLIKNIASKYYRPYIIEFEDITQSGVIGLIESIKRFDLNNGNRFSTFATFWIRKYILICLYGVSEKERRNNKFYNDNISIHIPTPTGESLINIISDDIDHFERLDNDIYNTYLRENILKAMYEINTDKEIQILKLYYGLEGSERIKLVDIEKKLNISYKEIIRIKISALRKLRKHRIIKQCYKEINSNTYNL